RLLDTRAARCLVGRQIPIQQRQCARNIDARNGCSQTLGVCGGGNCSGLPHASQEGEDGWGCRTLRKCRVIYPYKPSADSQHSVTGCLNWSLSKLEAPVHRNITPEVQRLLKVGNRIGTVGNCETTSRFWTCEVVITPQDLKK